MRTLTATILAFIVLNQFSTVPQPEAMAARGVAFLNHIAQQLGGKNTLCPGSKNIDPRWRCVFTKLSVAQIEQIVSNDAINDPRQTGPWDDDNAARFRFDGESLYTGNVLDGGQKRVFALIEVHP